MQTPSDSLKMFASVKTLALWTTILLTANVLLDVIQVGFESLQLFLISSQPETAASALSDSDADFSEMPGAGVQLAVLLHAGVAAIFNLLVLIATIIVFLIWEHRANSNLRPLGVPRLLEALPDDRALLAPRAVLAARLLDLHAATASGSGTTFF